MLNTFNLDALLVQEYDYVFEKYFRNVAKLLVGDPKWKDGLKHSRKLSIAHPFSRTTPLRDLIKTMPSKNIS